MSSVFRGERPYLGSILAIFEPAQMGYIGWPLSLRGSDESILDDEHYINKWAEDAWKPTAFGGK